MSSQEQPQKILKPQKRQSFTRQVHYFRREPTSRAINIDRLINSQGRTRRKRGRAKGEGEAEKRGEEEKRKKKEGEEEEKKRRREEEEKKRRRREEEEGEDGQRDK